MKNPVLKFWNRMSGMRLAGLLALSLCAAPSAFATAPVEGTLPSSTVARMSAWCDNTDLLLQRARQDAESALIYGDYATAESLLRQGLTEADQAGRQFRSNGPLTARAIFRGIQLADALSVTTAGALSGARTRTYFLFSYYDFVTDIIRNLDLPLYLPYRECGLCSRVNATVFEQRFVEYARRQVELPLSILAERLGGWGYGPAVTPVGTPAAFLKVLEISANHAGNDLQESLWGSRYACTVNSLQILAQKLARFNAGQGGYRDEVDAVNRAYFEADAALEQMAQVDLDGCHGGYRRR